MIESLYIKNYILVDEMLIGFGPGLNIITGETGAGKSIIISAIGQLCGDRASAELVRNGATKAVLELQVKQSYTPALIEELKQLDIDYEPDENLILRKEIKESGASRIFINDSPANLTTLNRLSQKIIDLHGQHQHQKLLHPENHILYLDAFGGLQDAISNFRKRFTEYKIQAQRLKQLKRNQAGTFEKQDMYRYQVAELENENLQHSEDEELKTELTKINNLESIHQAASGVSDVLYSGTENAVEKIITAEKFMDSLAAMDKEFKPFLSNIQQARETLEEVGRFTENYLNGLQFDPERFDQLNQRLSRLEFLFKKYQTLNVMV